MKTAAIKGFSLLAESIIQLKYYIISLADYPNAMKNLSTTILLLTLLIASCSKKSDTTAAPTVPPVSNPTNNSFTVYTIDQGAHYAGGNIYKALDLTEQKFIVRFDSSAIYQTVDPANQYDINKLYGFSDNNALHQDFSARIGWRWSDGALRLFGYVYNNSVRDSKELAAVAIGSEVNCSIKVTPTSYRFTVNNAIDSLPRTSTTATAKGYQLYPYFGGNETAPHQVKIWIKEL